VTTVISQAYTRYSSVATDSSWHSEAYFTYLIEWLSEIEVCQLIFSARGRRVLIAVF